MTPLCFVDTETTGVHPGRRPWEIAVIRVDDDGRSEHLLQIDDIDLSQADPFGLRVGRFYERHDSYAPAPSQASTEYVLVSELEAAVLVEKWTRGAHLIGAVPSFDAETLDAMLRRHQLIPAWHYHLIDVEALAIGFLSANGGLDLRQEGSLPWKSDDISRLCGVEPAAPNARHTALGDALWAERLYSTIVSGGVAEAVGTRPRAVVQDLRDAGWQDPTQVEAGQREAQVRALRAEAARGLAAAGNCKIGKFARAMSQVADALEDQADRINRREVTL